MPRHKSNRSLPFHVESLEERCLLAANVLDFQAGSLSSSPGFLGEFNNQLIVAHAGDASVGREVYVSDGTVAGTVLLADTQAGAAGAGFAALGEVNGNFIFRSSGSGLSQLWATDGTSGGTVSFASGANFDVNEIVISENRVFWIDSPNGADKELWSSDGTAAGTQRALQLGLGEATLEVSGNRAYVFLADRTDQGSGIVDHRMRVYSSTGTPAGTQLVFDVDEQFRDNSVGTTDSGRIFFSSDTDLWTTAGGTATRLGDFQDRVTDFREANGLVYFTVGNRFSNGTTWRSDGTSAGTFEFAPRAVSQIIEFDDYTAISQFSDRQQQEWFTTTDGVDLEPVFTVADYTRHLVTANSVWVDNGGTWTEILGPGQTREFLPFVDPVSSSGLIPTDVGPDGTTYFRGRDSSGDIRLFAIGTGISSAVPLAGADVFGRSPGTDIVGFFGSAPVVFESTPATGFELFIDTPNATSGVVNGVLLVNGTAGNDVISVFQAPNSDMIRVARNGTLTEYANVTGVAIAGGAGNDRITLGGSVPFAARVDGGSGDDFILATLFDDIIVGGAGNDTILALAGSDVVAGNAGNDRIFAGNGGNRGNRIAGGGGDDNLFGGNLADTIDGGAGNDFIHGVAGADILTGGFGNDTIVGGNGADLIFGNQGQDKLFGNAGTDELDGGEGDDEAFGAEHADTIYGGLGNDRLFGLGGADRILGGEGNDFINGSGGDDILLGEIGDDEIYGGDGDDYVEGDDLDRDDPAGDDELFGGRGQDRLYGDDGDDVIRGQGGNDQIFVGDGDDIAYGGRDNDQIFPGIFGSGAGINTLYGDEGDDFIEGGGARDFIFGGEGDDWVNGKAGNDVIDGGVGDDNLNGEAGIDTINGGDGDDQIDGGLGNNRLYGDAGNDTLIAHMGHDILEGGAGSDILNSGFGNDTLRGGLGNDLLFAGGGTDELYGDAGSDLLVSEVFDQVLRQDEMDALRAIWNRAQALTTRRFVVLNGSDASFSHKISFGERVRIDGFSDTIFGGDGSDLILAENGQAQDVGAIDILELP